MSAYGKSKIAWGIFRSFALGSNQQLGKPYLFRASRFHTTCCSEVLLPAFSQWKVGFSGSSLVSSNFGLKQTQNNSNLLHGNVVAEVGRRYYNADSFKQTPKISLLPVTSTDPNQTSSTRGSSRTSVDKKQTPLLAVYLALICMTDSETLRDGEAVPWWYRKLVREHGFEEYLKKTHKSETVLPATHPTREKVARIAQDVFDALRRGLKDPGNVWGGRVDALGATQNSPRTDWEVFVVDDPRMRRVRCYKGGKIVVYTGVLDRLNSDAEIAYTIAQEVAFSVAKPHIQDSTIRLGICFLTASFIGGVALPDERFPCLLPFIFLIGCSSVPIIRQSAYEFGLLLTASSGYNPQKAVPVKTEEISPFCTQSPQTQKVHSFSDRTRERAMAVYQKSLSSLGDQD